ncbi:xylulokinase [Sanguibacter gelidistatuariae]|uniref:Xylulose kinase n=1 Tax=Sanguibacter gelidistatuariae TaxID=1814289 RepID=A0A1G6UUX5_9MICO|nr:FGGY family carbohydrate kinase [Sanguibacter gelidistatuariae]SDD44397.1 xylulokinase [Sanguibacter gelidistatuariae]
MTATLPSVGGAADPSVFGAPVGALVAGVDSSTQSCKVVVRDAVTGALLRSGSASHPAGTEVDPAAWWVALGSAVAAAGGLHDVAALAVGGQQHGMVLLDADGEVIRPALLWNDNRSAGAASDLIHDLGVRTGGSGEQAWADAIGTVPVASLTVTKLRWVADHEPENAARIAAVCLPHDWLTWQISGAGGVPGAARDLGALTTDRSDASGTGYFSGATGEYRLDLLDLALGEGASTRITLPRVLGPGESGGSVEASVLAEALGAAAPAASAGERIVLGAGAGDNAAAALGLGMATGDVAVSIGTSGVVSAISALPSADGSGLVAGFSDATGAFLPLACTLNASRVLDGAAQMLGVDHAELSRLALTAPAGADGLVLVPFLEGERTPNRPDATGTLHGVRLANMTPAHLARAAVEGMLCGLADGLDALVAQGAKVERLLMIGGGAKSEAVREIAPQVFGLPVEVPPAGEYVADGAARQAAWVLVGGGQAPAWPAASGTTVHTAAPEPVIREQYAAVRDLV